MTSRNLILAALLVGAPLLSGCGPSEEESKAAARVDEWSALEADQKALEGLRAELRAARETAESAAEAVAEKAEDAAEEVAESPEAAAVKELQGRVNEATDKFLERLVSFINDNAAFEGETPAPEVSAAIRAKSSEDVLLAREYVERGGDYAKAIDILQSALAVDPGNPELTSELAEAERLRYMDQERFSQVKKGMTEPEVRGVLGQVKHQNVRKYEDGKVVAWFFPKEGGAAAAVFFRPRDGRLKVYDTNFEAVKSAAERAASGEDDEDPASE